MQSKLQSQRHAVVTNYHHLPTCSTAGGGNGAPPYIALTPQAHQRQDLHQASSLRDIELEYIQVDQVGRIKGGFETLGINLNHDIHAKLYHDPIGMAPMELFKASPTSASQVNMYHVLTQHVNGKILTQTPSQKYTYRTSSIIVNVGGEAIDRDCYAQNNVTDAIVFAPGQQYHVSGSTYVHGVAHWDNVLNGLGAQFDPYLYSDYAASPCVVDDDALEG